MAKRRKPAKDIWDEDDFIDINSHSDGEPPQRARPLKERSGRRPPPRQGPAPGSGRPSQARGPGQGKPSQPGRSPQQDPRRRPPPPGRQKRPTRPGSPPPERRPKRPDQPRKRRPPMPKGLRRALMLLLVAAMLVVTCVLGISLLFKISEITVTGDLVYAEEDILRLCDYKMGDNLVFISTRDREKRLKEELPYIADVDIRRHLPGTLEIHITGTDVACCVYADGNWLYISGEGKILERQAEPRQGVMQVQGITPVDPQIGGQVELEDESLSGAYNTIFSTIVELGAWGDFTRLDLADPYNIILWYQDRVQCRLGNTTELAYKVQFGYKLWQEGKIGPEETGILDLSYADVRRAGFTAMPLEDIGLPASSGQPAGDSSSPESQPEDSGGEDGSGTDENGEDDPGGRGGDIPDAPIS